MRATNWLTGAGGLFVSVSTVDGLSGVRILLCEDNEVNQEVTQLYLRRLGCDLDIAENGKIGLEYWQNNTYDLILMDGQMPVMDGFEATRQIRKIESNPKSSGRTPIVALTAFAMDRDRRIAAGMDNYLSKPFTVDQLAHILIAKISKIDQKYRQLLPS
jgi:CheY-like chemotaxis protein